MQILKNRAFTLIEILIVIFIIALLAFIAWPKLSDWISDRQVRGEVYRLVQYIEGKKEDAIYGKMAMTRIWISDKPESGKSQAWEMSDEQFASQRQSGKLGKWCPNPRNQYSSESSDTFEWNRKVTSNRTHLCIDRDGIIDTDMESQNGIPGKVKFIVCLAANTGPDYSKLCYWNRDKIKHRYVIKVDIGTKIKVYKYNINNDKWILQRL